MLTSQLAGHEMRAGILTGSTSMDAMGMEGHAMALPLFMVTWLVMMAAMMFPAIVPVVMLVHRWSTSRGLGSRITVPFVAGYLSLWGSAGLMAYGLLTFLESRLVGGPSLMRLGGALIVIAGIYQLTPLKDTCLRQCRSPLSLLMQHARTLQSGVIGRLRVGAVHGAYCLGCCWALMTVLVLIGMMNLAWMAAVAAVVLAEKVLTSGTAVTRGLAVVLVGAGLVVVISGAPILA
ncbi:MAG: DUF2182 domain-containing protein [Actinomycetota bacterium]|nr:DUF2182 domain-containing protein [Actinomycetota bacterium]